MAGRIVLVTGVTRFIGSELAGRLAAHPAVERVIGVDAALPEPAARARMGAADFARVDIRNPLVARVIEAAGVDTVVHASASATPASSAARTMVKEMNVLGTMQLLAACQRSESVQHLVVRSTAAVYGASPRDPAIFTEDTSARSVPSAGPARDAIDIEAYVRGFGRRRPDVRIAVPRFADVIGPTVVTPLTRYFALSPVVPMVLGRDARLQFVHEQDAVAVLEHLAVGDFAGTVNVAGDGFDHVGAGDPPGGPGAVVGPRRRPRRAVAGHENAAAGRVLAGPGEAAGGGPGAGHDPAAGASGVRPTVHHRRGVRRLRRDAAAGGVGGDGAPGRDPARRGAPGDAGAAGYGSVRRVRASRPVAGGRRSADGDTGRFARGSGFSR